MQFEDSIFIAAPVSAVWKCLMDNDSLQSAIPGCSSITRKPEGGLNVALDLKLGFVQKKVVAHLQRKDIEKAQSLTFIGKIGSKHSGNCAVNLTAEGEGTRLSYVVSAEVGIGKSGLGAFVLKNTAKKLIGDFIGRLGKLAITTAA